MRKVLPYMGAALSALALMWTTPASAQNQFKDLDPNHWAYAAVNDLQQKQIIEGYPDGYFKGKRALTRYEFAIALKRALDKIGPGQQGPKGDKGDTGAPGEPGPKGDQGPPGMTPEEVTALRNLTQEFRNELTSLGANVRDINNRLDTLSRDVAALKDEISRMPKIGGQFFVGARTDRSRFGFVDYSGAVRGASATHFGQADVPHDFHVDIRALLNGGVKFTGDLVASNYLSYRGNTLSGGPAAVPAILGGAPNWSERGTIYQAQLDVPIAGVGSNTELTVGRYKNQVTPLTFWRPDYDVYFDVPVYDDGNYVQDGIRFRSKFGSATTSLWVASHATVVSTGGFAINQPLYGALGGLRSGLTAPFGIANSGGIAINQTAGLHVGVPLGHFGELGLTGIILSANTPAVAGVPYTGGQVYGANLKINPIGRFTFNAEAAKSVTSASLSGSDGLDNEDNNAYLLNLGWGSGPVTVQAGYQYIDPRFSAPGYWNKIGNVYNMSNVKGPFVRVGYKLTNAIMLSLGGDFLEGARNRANLAPTPGGILAPSGFTIDDNITAVKAGLKWNINKKLNALLEYEGVFYDLSGAGAAAGATSASGVSAKPFQQFLTIGAGLNLASNTVLKMAYQIINIQDFTNGFGLAGGAGVTATSTSNATVLTTQLAVRF